MARPGLQIGPYELVSVLGHGGFGSVWLARWRDSGLGGEVALKVLHPDHLREVRSPKGPSAVERFLGEARIIQRLSHPGLVEIYDVIDARDESFVAYAMEKLEGCDLTQVGDQLDLETILDVIAEAAETLAFVHREGVIHRDVKPQNIFICNPRPGLPNPCRVKVIDFGTAKDLLATERGAATGTNVLIGTLASMAPEAFKPRPDPTPALDQWGLGVALFLTLTGKPPFFDLSMGALVKKIEKDPPPPLDFLPRFGAESVRAELEAIVSRCLQKSPGDRYASMDDVARALRVVGAKLRAEAEQRATTRAADPAFADTVPAASPALMELAPRYKLAQVMVQRAAHELEVRTEPPSAPGPPADDGSWATVIRADARADSLAPPDRDTDPDPIPGAEEALERDTERPPPREAPAEPPSGPHPPVPAQAPITIDGDELRATVRIDLEAAPTQDLPPAPVVEAHAPAPARPPAAPATWSWGMIMLAAVVVAAAVLLALWFIPRP